MPQPFQITSALRLLEQILLRRKERGVETVAVSAESVAKLQRLPGELRQAGTNQRTNQRTNQQPSPLRPQPAPPRQTDPTATLPSPAPQLSGLLSEQATAEGTNRGRILKTEWRGRVEILHPSGETKREKLISLFFAAKESGLPKALPSLRDQLVFARGNPEARVVFVGEAPGDEEEKLKKPFVGPAGQKLDSILSAMGLNPEADVYISNVVKFRPKIGDGRFQGVRNRKPTPEEMAACVKFVRSEIEIIQPAAIVALGGTAAEGLLDLSGSVTAMRGKDYQLDGIPAVVTYHPAYLLRVEGGINKAQALSEKRKVWEDMIRVMEILGLPISEKQRGFFSK